MDDAMESVALSTEQDRRIFETFEREKRRLGNFIRKRVADDEEAKDILQDVFYELVEAYRLMKPIEQAGAWLFRVARNRITDLFRKKSLNLSTLVRLQTATEKCSCWKISCLRRKRVRKQYMSARFC